MAKLSDLFVRITGDDRPYNATAEKVRRSLLDLDRTKVEPSVTLPAKPVADIEGLQKRLQSLGKQKVSLNVSSTVARADVKVLEGQLEGLQRRRVEVPIELQDGINRQMAEVQRDLEAASRKQTRIPLTMQRIDAQVEAAKAQIASLSADQDVRVAVDADTAGAAAKIRALTLREQVAQIRVDINSESLANASRGVSNLATAILALGPAAIPILAATTAGLGAVGAAALGAGGAAGVFGGSVAGTVAEMTKAQEEMKKTGVQVDSWNLKVEQSKAVLNGTKKGTDEYDAALKRYKNTVAQAESAQQKLTRQQDDFNRTFGPAAGGLDAVRTAWGRFMDATRPATVQVMGKALQVVADILPRLAPVSNAAAVAVGALLDRFGEFTRGPVMQGVIDFLVTRGPAMLTSFVNITANVAKGIISLFSAFLPVSDQVVGGLEKMTASFARWAKGLGASDSFRNFMDYVRANAPTVLDFVSNIFTTVVRLVQALAPFGGTMLGILNAISAGINGLPVPVVRALAGVVGTVVVALKAWQLGIFATVAAQRIATVATVAYRVAMLAVNAVLAANPIGLVIAALAALTVGLIVAYKRSETFRNIVNGVGAALKGGFLAAVDGVRSAIGKLGEVWDSAVTATSGAWQRIKSAVSEGWQSVVDFFKGAGTAIATPVAAIWTSIRDKVGTAFAAIGAAIKAAVGLWWEIVKVEVAVIGTIVLLAWQGISKLTSFAFNTIKDNIITPVWQAISGIFTRVTGVIRTAVSAWWTNVTAIFRSSFEAIRDRVVIPVWNAVSTIFSRVTAAIRTAVSTWWTNLTANFRAAFTAIRDRVVTPVWTAISGIFTRVTAAIRTAVSTWWTNLTARFSTAFSAIRTTLSATWDRIKTIWTSAQTSVREKWDAFWGRIKSIGAAAIDSVKSRIDTVFGKIKGGTQTFVDAVGRIFNGIKSAFSAPWDWVSKNVFGKIGSAYNTVARLVGAKTINLANGGSPGGGGGVSGGGGGRAVIGFANGGPIRGVGGPRQDNIMGIDRRTGVQTSWVSNREFVVNAASYEANKPIVEAINEAHGPLRKSQAARADGGEVQNLFLGGGVQPVPGRGNQQSGYPWTRWTGDFPVPTGTPIRAYKAGQVSAVRSLTTSYGKHVRINHGAENTLYAHMQKFAVAVGQQVRENQVIGYSDSTGNSTGPHLHFELAGGSSKLDTSTGGSGGIRDLLSFIKPRAMFTKAAGAILRVVGKGLGALGLGQGKTPVAEMIGRLPQKFVDMLASKLPESFGSSDSGGGAAPTGTMLGNAKIIAQVGASLGRKAQITALATSLVESGLKNVNYGDRDSLGLFQQRAAWGPASARLNPAASASMFYRGGRGGQRGLDDIPGWRGMAIGRLAQAVQVSAFPGRYATQVGRATSILDQVNGLATGGIVKGGRGGVTARVGEGRFDELVTPLPRGWQSGGGNDSIDRLVALLESRPAGEVRFDFVTYNPVAEAQSVTTNKALQRVAGLGLVG